MTDGPVTPPVNPAAPSTWKPTKKWWAALVSGLATVAVHAILSDGWDATENAELVTLAGALIASFLKSNDPTPGGVPVEDPVEPVAVDL